MDVPAEIAETLRAMFASEAAIERWLRMPLPSLRWRTPLETIQAGETERVLAVLEAIHSGFAG